ncbi:serine hydrolase domain-containing protein [Micromonospora craniellae]|uniref:Beta-lactamase-related domain-containing protein n=1 Tax=Micromonospora craniellae TaxID=2294034 RepID=A0A372FSQ2_9ACTN|nr:hypothetical protein [Micromonospora craniellae]QOC91763.1 hypothetical protein ID554_28215 [Micromonospora craniellae]RFS43781.1 hypothetical protein D0Q02_25970 [Micromonospora craniellae]
MTDEVDAGLTKLVQSLSARPALHHASLAVSSADGQRRWAGGSGPQGSAEPEVRPEAPFFIASITKRFIITLVLQGHARFGA